MNKTISIGRLTDDPKVTTTSEGKKVARFTLALDRRGSDRADFPSFNAWEQRAEFCEKYLHKGMKIAVEGSLRTGYYDKDGNRVYTTDVLAEQIEFCEKKADGTGERKSTKTEDAWMDIPDGLDEELPFN